MTYRLLSILLMSTALTACDWVDSAGVQYDAPSLPKAIVDGGQLMVLESTKSSASLNSKLTNWQWEKVAVNRNGSCSNVSDFNADLAANTLKDACTDRNNCQIAIQENYEGGTNFSITTPSLKAPIAIAFKVSASNARGEVASIDQTLCLVSINEAPIAADDSYELVRNINPTIRVTGSNSLLANDVDDADVQNKKLSVITTPAQAPKHADFFELNENGSFTYHLSAAAAQDKSITEDVFAYEVSDGLHTTTASVKINLTSRNIAPVASSIPTTTVRGTFKFSIANYFSDADGDNLKFSAQYLPTGASMSADGTISGVSDWTNWGNHLVKVTADDGRGGSVSDIFVIRARL